jgi:hypothetical protein
MCFGSHYRLAGADAPPAPPRGRTWWRGALLLGLVLALGAKLSAQVSREYDLKAVFLYNFASFVDWPAGEKPAAKAPFIIGVLGDDPFGRVLTDVVQGENINGSPLQVRRCRTLAEAQGCQILFVSKTGAPPVAEVCDALRGRPVLTVGDNPEFVQQGGMIGFSTNTGHLQLHINARAARAASLNISSKLLRVAKVSGEDSP